MTAERETEPITTTSPLQQGDVLEWLDDHFKEPWHAYAVVITGDCDLAWHKHCGSVTLVPVITGRTLVDHFLLPEEVTRLADRAAEQVTLQLKAAVGAAISPQALWDWLDRCGDAGVLAEIEGATPSLADAVRRAGAIRRALVAGTPTALAALFQAELAGERRKFSDKIANYFCKPPGDVFFIESLSPSLGGGFFALLRFPQQVDEHAVALDRLELTSKACHAKRVARLKSPFSFRLTQMFAAVFADIGLPDWRKEAALKAATETQRAVFGGYP